jgi:hypothetical protein
VLVEHRQRIGRRLRARAQRDEADDALGLQLIRHIYRRRFCNQWVRHWRALDLRAAQAVAGHPDHIVVAADDAGLSIRIDRSGVACAAVVLEPAEEGRARIVEHPVKRRGPLERAGPLGPGRARVSLGGGGLAAIALQAPFGILCGGGDHAETID